MDAGQVFQISFVTADDQKNTGGELITVARARKHNWLSPADRKKQQQLQPVSSMVKKDPRHFANSTRNIQLLSNSDIRKIHIRLIRTFNHKTVL